MSEIPFGPLVNRAFSTTTRKIWRKNRVTIAR